MNKKDYPLIILKSTASLQKKIRTVVEKYSDIIAISKIENFTIELRDSGKDSTFYFKVENPKKRDRDVFFTTTYKPSSAQVIDGTKAEFNSEKVLKYLNIWVLYIVEYNLIELSINDKIINQYEEEFFHDFEIIDENADTEAFNLTQQVLIDKFLTKTILLLEENNKEENQELIEEASELKNQITRLNKKELIKRLGNLIAKIRVKGLPILKKVIEIAGKEVIKRLTNTGLDQLL